MGYGEGKSLYPTSLATAILLCFLVGAPTAYAATGLDYLPTQQNPNGSFGNTPTSLATPMQSTTEVLHAFQTLGETAQPVFGPALTFLNSDTENNTEFLARKIIVNVQAGNDVSSLLSELLTHQNFDGGFGDLGYCSSCPDNEYCKGGQSRPKPKKRRPTKSTPSGRVLSLVCGLFS